MKFKNTMSFIGIVNILVAIVLCFRFVAAPSISIAILIVSNLISVACDIYICYLDWKAEERELMLKKHISYILRKENCNE